MKIILYDRRGQPASVYVFTGRDHEVPPEELFRKEQLDDYKKNNTQIIQSAQFIFGDDSIHTIKAKIASEINKTAQVSMDECYMFYTETQPIEPIDFFNQTTGNNQTPLYGYKLGQSLFNTGFSEKHTRNIPYKQRYTYSDILAMDIHRVQLFKPLGMEFTDYYDFTYSGNPFQVLQTETPTFENRGRNVIIAMDNNLLFNYAVTDTIHMVTLETLLEYCEDNGFDESYFTRTYFPALAKDNVLTQSDLEKWPRPDLKFNKPYHENVQFLHELNRGIRGTTERITYSEDGIARIKFTIHARGGISLPLETLFKDIHCTTEIPVIKFNPGKSKENIYRLFTENTTRQGTKIPVLPKSTVIADSKRTDRPHTITFYMHGDDTTYISLDETANIDVEIIFKTPTRLAEAENMIREQYRDIESMLNRILMRTGFSIPSLKSLSQTNVEVSNVEYSIAVRSEKGIKPEKCASLFGSIFNIIDKKKNMFELNYKRVDNYKEMDAVNRTIHDGYNASASDKEILDRLMQNYQFSEKVAQQKMSEFLDGFNRIRNRFTNKGLHIVENPGFPATLQYVPFENQIIFSIKDLNSIHYIAFVRAYVDSLIRILAFPHTVGDDISKCTKKVAVEEAAAEMVVKPVDARTSIVPEMFREDPRTKEDEEDEEDDFVFFDDADDDDDDDDETEGGVPINGGAPEGDATNMVDGSHIDGLSLTRPNLFGKRLKQYDPKLFVTRRQGKFKTYSRLCQFSEARQPVILTQEEKENIDKNHPGSYTHSIEYGSGDKKYHYICPRYWCLLTNSSITQEELDSGKCGKVIPPDSETVPPGHYVYEFTHKKHVDAQGNYIHFSPGFIDGKTHPDGLPVPCCFKSWDPKAQENAQRQIEEGNQDARSKPAASAIQYIIGFDSVPIEDKRYGFVPPSVERFLQIDYKNAVQANNPSALKQGVQTMLRAGTEQSPNKSFMGCLADIHAYVMKTPSKMSISEFCIFVRDTITLDDFVRLHDGDLVSHFRPGDDGPVEVEKYAESRVVKKSPKSRGTRDTIRAYEQFRKFLVDPASTINHVFMWDIIANTDRVFGMAINPIIIEVNSDDITNNVGVICPSSTYTSATFNPDKPSVILLKQDNYYEILSVVITDEVNRRKRYHNMKLFYLDDTIAPELQSILTVLTKTTTKMCKPLPSQPDVYFFDTNVPANDVVHRLRTGGYVVDAQVMNPRNKAIAIIARRDNDEKKGIYIPCRASSMVDLPVKTTFDDLWHDYDYTVKKLREAHADTRVLCDPRVKVLEGGLIVGILTQTNQFVQVTPSEPVDDDIPSITEANHLQADNALISEDEDTERIRARNSIALETRFFNAYRNLVRMLLQKTENREVLDEIGKYVSDERYLYKHKITKIMGIVQSLVNEVIEFAEYDPAVIEHLDNIYSCFETPEEKQYCVLQNDRHKLMIPKTHLISGNNNRDGYAMRIADELVRNRDFSQFMLSSDDIIRLPDTEYHVNDDEFILLHSNIQTQYMENLEPFSDTNYVTLNTYNRAQPEVTQYYSNVAVPEVADDADNYVCVERIHPSVRNKWKTLFPENSKEIEFSNDAACSYAAAQYIIQKSTNIEMTVPAIKELLSREYASHGNKVKLLQLWRSQGKERFVNAVEEGESMESVILREDYFFSDLDAVILFDKLQIGVVLYANAALRTLPGKSRHVALGDRTKTHRHYFMYSENKASANKYSILRDPFVLSDILDENVVRLSIKDL